MLPHYLAALLVTLEHPSGTARFSNQNMPLSDGSETFSGIGALVSTAETRQQLSAIGQTFDFVLSGFEQSVIDDTYTTDARGAPINVKLATFDVRQNPMTLVSEELIFRGVIAHVSVIGREILVASRSAIEGLGNATEYRYTDRMQQRIFPGDRFFALYAERDITRVFKYNGRGSGQRLLSGPFAPLFTGTLSGRFG